MTAVRTGRTQVVVPRAQASAAHDVDRAAQQPRTRDGDTFEVAARSAASTGPAGSIRRSIVVEQKVGGAYFHKITTPARADASGIRVEGRLPEVVFSPSRWAVRGAPHAAVGQGPQAMTRQLLTTLPFNDAMAALTDYRTRPLDTPSVYLGGHAGKHEADVGLSYDRVYDTNGRAVFTNQPEGASPEALRNPKNQFTWDPAARTLNDGTGRVIASGEAEVKQAMLDHKLMPSYAFRPYWRVSPSVAGTTNWANPPRGTDAAITSAWAKATNHVGEVPRNAVFYPGENFAMAVSVKSPGVMRLDIRGDGVDGGVPAFNVAFKAPEFGSGKAQEFKRVSSIDQRGREGKSVVPTSTMAIGLVWKETQLLLGKNATPTPLASLPSTQVRGKDFKDPAAYDRVFNTDVVNGAEVVSIRP